MKGLEEFEAWPVVASESQGILKSGEEEGGGGTPFWCLGHDQLMVFVLG